MTCINNRLTKGRAFVIANNVEPALKKLEALL